MCKRIGRYTPHPDVVLAAVPLAMSKLFAEISETKNSWKLRQLSALFEIGDFKAMTSRMVLFTCADNKAIFYDLTRSQPTGAVDNAHCASDAQLLLDGTVEARERTPWDGDSGTGQGGAALFQLKLACSYCSGRFSVLNSMNTRVRCMNVVEAFLCEGRAHVSLHWVWVEVRSCELLVFVILNIEITAHTRFIIEKLKWNSRTLDIETLSDEGILHSKHTIKHELHKNGGTGAYLSSSRRVATEPNRTASFVNY